MIFIKSPFTPNSIETNCETYGIRESVIRDTVYKLLNDNSVLITGTRGIGKSSLQYQLQQILKGNNKILSRCNINISIPEYHTYFYECVKNDTVENIFANIIQEMIEDIRIEDKNFEIKGFKLGANLGIFQGKIEAERTKENSRQNLVNSFVDLVLKYQETYVSPKISIAIDEIDQISHSSNIAHFIKIILETLDRNNLCYVSFILAGQTKIVEDLLKQQPSFNRLVTHFELEPLSEAVTKSVFENSLLSMDKLVEISEWGLNLLIKLSNGHPYLIQLLGDEALNAMLRKTHENDMAFEIQDSDCINAIIECLKRNAHRYDIQWLELSEKERYVLQILIDNNDNDIKNQIEMETPKWGQKWIIKEYQNTYKECVVDSILETLHQLCHKQILRYWHATRTNRRTSGMYSFNDEMFRVYLCVDKDILKGFAYLL